MANKEITLEKVFKSFEDRGMISFHMPGHKNNFEKFDFLNEKIGRFDNTEIEGLDNLQNPKEALLNLQTRLSKLYKSKKTYISLNGSTGALLASIFALTKPNDHVLIQRNSHKSVYNGITLRGLIPRFIVPEYIEDFNIFGSVTVDSIKDAFTNDPEIKLVIITSPSYEGVMSNIKDIAIEVHKHGAKLLVDSAHGAHLGFGYSLPNSHVVDGADVVVMSLHKTMPSINPCALIHITSDNVSGYDIQKYINMFQTTSPSYVALYLIERLVDMLETNMDNVFQDLMKGIELIKAEANNFNNIKILGYNSEINSKEIYDFDYSKVLVNFGDIKGDELGDILREDYQIEPEYILNNKCLFMLGPGDSVFNIADLIVTLNELDQEVKPCNCSSDGIMTKIPKVILNPYEIETKTLEYVKFDKCVNRILGEKIYNYPPGSPIVIEGELMEDWVYQEIQDKVKRHENVISETTRFPCEVLVVKENKK